jgi:hypothetical protein
MASLLVADFDLSRSGGLCVLVLDNDEEEEECDKWDILRGGPQQELRRRASDASVKIGSGSQQLWAYNCACASHNQIFHVELCYVWTAVIARGRQGSATFVGYVLMPESFKIMRKSIRLGVKERQKQSRRKTTRSRLGN